MGRIRRPVFVRVSVGDRRGRQYVKVAELVAIPTDEEIKPADAKGAAPMKVRKDTRNEFI